MNITWISSSRQGEHKGKVKVRFISEPCMKQWKLTLTQMCVGGSRTMATCTFTHTHTRSHIESGAACGPSREQSSADGCQVTVGLVISSPQKMWGEKKKHPACSHRASIFTTWAKICFYKYTAREETSEQPHTLLSSYPFFFATSASPLPFHAVSSLPPPVLVFGVLLCEAAAVSRSQVSPALSVIWSPSPPPLSAVSQTDANFCSAAFSPSVPRRVSLSTSHFSFSVIYLRPVVFCLRSACKMQRTGVNHTGWDCSYKRGTIWCLHVINISLSFQSGCKTWKRLSLLFASDVTSRFLKYIPCRSPLPHFSISPLSSTLPAPLAVSCHSTFLSWCHPVPLVAQL